MNKAMDRYAALTPQQRQDEVAVLLVKIWQQHRAYQEKIAQETERQEEPEILMVAGRSK